MDKNEKRALIKKGIQTRKLSVKMAVIFFRVILGFFLALAIFVYTADLWGISPHKSTYPVLAIWIIAALSVLLSSFANYFIVRKVFAPLEELSEASLKVAEGDFTTQVSYDGDLEELSNTVENFNRMVKELNSVEIMRNDFVADVSHEFKTPLSAITGYATFLQDPELSQEEKDEYIRKIFFNVDKLNELTENILRLSKLEHQQFLDEPVQYRLDEQIREAIVLLEPKWGRKNMMLDLDLPEVTYLGQKSLLFQVWMNIIGNAIKYTDDNGTIKVSLKETAEHYEVLVSDNGIGMNEETQAHIFNKFYQADTSRKSQGNGLGLPLCKEIVSKCEGKIIVESKLGVGSVFIVQLPKLEISEDL